MAALNIKIQLKEVFDLPENYLGANIDKVQLEYGWVVWSASCADYFNSTIDNVNN